MQIMMSLTKPRITYLTIIAIGITAIIAIGATNPAMSLLLGSYFIVENNGVQQSNTREILDFDDTGTIDFAISDEAINSTSGKTNIAGSIVSGSVTGTHLQDHTVAEVDLAISKQFFITSNNAISPLPTLNQTMYYPLGTGNTFVTSVENQTEITMPFGGTIKRLRIDLTDNNLNTDGLTISVRKNNADSALSISYNANESATKTDTDNVSFSAGDTLNIQEFVPAGEGSGEWLALVEINFTL